MRPSELIPFNRPLRKHQADALDRFAGKDEMALFHEMGTGKTTTAIAWLRAKYNEHKVILPTLIVSPVATLGNWLNEFKINSPQAVLNECEILYGSGADRLKILSTEKKILITNPETFDMSMVVTRLKQKGFFCIVIDESHRFKSHKSKRFDALLTISDSCPYRAIMTGTPILNSYLDIFAQWRILDLGAAFSKNFFLFRNTYFRDANEGWKGKPKYYPNYIPRNGIDVQISGIISDKSSRITKDECLDLPPLIQMTEHVELSKEQRQVYDQMETELIAEVKGGACVASNALTRVLRLLQILTGYLQAETIENQKFSHVIKDNPRLGRLTELLEELTPAHKVIVWCTFQENYKMIKAACDELKIGYAELTGQTKDRQENIDSFQDDPACRVMISNPQAGGVGVNLTAASYAIYYSRNFSLGDRLQSEARNHRGGSEVHKKITLIDLVAPNTLDETVLQALLRKENFSDNILERLKK